MNKLGNLYFVICQAFILTMLGACSNDSPTNIIDLSNLDSETRIDNNNECSEANIGDKLFTEDSTKIFLCNNKKWRPLNNNNSNNISESDTAFVLERDSVLIIEQDTLYINNIISIIILKNDTLYLNEIDSEIVPKKNIYNDKTDSVVTFKKDTLSINKTDSVVISKKDTLYINKIDSVVISEKDTLYINKIDSVVISEKDTLYINKIDSVIISKKDTLYINKIDSVVISEKDTVFIEESKKQGTGILDFNPESEIIPIMENLVHQKRGTNYKLQAQQVVLLHITDIHGDGENLKRIKEFKDAYSNYIDVVIHTGDVVYENWTDPTEFWSEAGAGEFLNTLGNHDVYYKYGLSETQNVPKEDVYNRFFAPYIASWNVIQPENATENFLMYYYKDIVKGSDTELAKLRLIVLDEYHWDEDQSLWLIDVLEDARINDFAVIICRHNGFDAIPLKNNPFTSLEHNGSATDLIEAQVAVDNFMQKGGEFVVWLGGHSHQDAVGRLPNYPKQIIFLGDLSGMNWTGWNDSWRESGTKSQDCFTLIGIDRFEKIVRFVRIGADRDRYGRKKDAMSFNYSTSETIYPAE